MFGCFFRFSDTAFPAFTDLSKEFPLEVREPHVFLFPIGVRENKPSPTSYGIQKRAANMAEIGFIRRSCDRSPALRANGGQLW